jgi:outer membrane protein insertion porin family
MKLLHFFSLLFAFLCVEYVIADMKISNIQVQGNQYIDKDTVLNYLPLKIGDGFTFADSHEHIKALYKTGFFKNIKLYKQNNTLIVKIKENPAIFKVEYKGNIALPDENLDEILSSVNLKKGKIFNRAKLENLKHQMQEFYFSRGLYSSRISSKIVKLEKNRVEVYLEIYEGPVALIRKINIVGNVRFSEKLLLSIIELEGANGIGANSEYSKSQLEADEETIRSYYMDRGHINYTINSTEVTISPNKQDIYININQTEGDIYTVAKIRLHGKYHLTNKTIREQFKFKTGDIYSRKKVYKTISAIKDRFGLDGYAFANVEVIPDINEENKTVSFDFYIKPKEKVFVRRINIHGNNKTHNEVFRREFRQMEASIYNPKKLKRSKIRIQRLPYIETVDIRTTRVPNYNDQVDLNVHVKEMSSGSFTIGGAYSSVDGFTFTTNFSQSNMFGTGDAFKMSLSRSSVTQNFNMTLTDPYWSDDGISRSHSYYYNNTDASEISNTASYYMNSYGISTNYGIPRSEIETIFLGIGFDNIKIGTTDSTTDEINAYVAKKGDEYNDIYLYSGYVRDTKNRSIFATDGTKNSLSLNVTIPGSGLEYYKSKYDFEYYYPISERYTFNFHSNVSYGNSYDDDLGLPFFKRYYAGGVYSVRGYGSYSIGPKDVDGKATGGNLKTTGSFELIFPPVGVDISGPTRFSIFSDFGGVYQKAEDFNTDDYRYSVGVAFKWYSAMGPLVFSFANALNPKEDDKTESFQFYIGGVF